MLEIKNLSKSFGNVEVLKSLNLEVNTGEVVVLVGPSGGGKTTLLKIINGLIKCDKGTITINNEIYCENGKYVNKEKEKQIKKNIGLVFQEFNLFPHMSVMENIIEAPLRVLKLDKKKAISKARELLKFLGLEDKEMNYPCELSGGQKQRVAIARALALEPKLLCFDEPTSALDPSLTGEVAKIIKDLSKNNVAILIITHDMDFAKMVADRVISIKDGEIVHGHIYENTI